MSLWIDESRWKTHPCVTSPSRWFEAGAACVSRANQCASPIYELPSFHLRLAIVRKQRVFAVGRPLEVFTPRKYTAPENVAKFTRLSKLRNELITQASVALAPCSLSVAPSLSSILSLSFCLSLSLFPLVRSIAWAETGPSAKGARVPGTSITNFPIEATLMKLTSKNI